MNLTINPPHASRILTSPWIANRVVAEFLAMTTLTICLTSVGAASDAYIPKTDEEVLETLPRTLLANRTEFEKLRERQRNNPENSDLAVKLANQYVQLGNAEGDPRYYGYARAALGPWWNTEEIEPEALALRAKLKEKDHRYDEAATDLKLLLEQEPRDAQAWINLANIYRVQGKYAQATEVGRKLDEFAGPIPTMLCNAPIMALTGQAEQAFAQLKELMPLAQEQFPSTESWILTMQAEIAVALGRDTEAEEVFLSGLEADPTNLYLLRSYADFLLDRGRESEVLDRLAEHQSDNGILLRLAIAARRLGNEPEASQWQRQLQTRFDEIRLRGSEPHGRFESRFALEVLDDPQRALELAQANWEKQKEIRDTRIFLEAAIAAEDPQAAQPVLEFLKKHGTEHAALSKLVEELDPK